MATADWNPLGEIYYKKCEVYSMGWSDIVDISKFEVSAAPYGGPIALLKDESKTARVQVSTKPIITVFTAAGKQISQMRWNSGSIHKMGWSHTEDLLFVQDDGVVLVYDMFLTFKKTFGMGQEAKDVKVIDCKIFSSYQGTGIAVLTSTYRVFIINSVDDPRIRRLAEVPGLSSAPSSWAVINLDRQSRALIAKGSELCLIDQGGQYQVQTPDVSTEVTQFLAMSLSFNNRCLAMFTDKGVIWIGSSDLQKKYCEFNTKSPTPPQQLSWCGAGAVVGLWGNMMLVVGPDKDWINFNFDNPVHLVEEEDGLRIIGKYQHEFLYKVPGSDERFEEPNRKHVKLWPNILPVDDTEKEIDIYTDKIVAVSEIKTKHFDITNGSKKSAEGSDQEDSFHQESEMKNVQTRTFADDTTECSEASIPVQVINLEKTATTDGLSSPNKDNAILSLQNTQKEVVICQNDDQHSRDTTESEGVSEEVAVKKDEYVYRLLRFDEGFGRGLRPKNIRSKTSLKEHVENGSNEGAESRFISCCKTIDGLEELARVTNKSYRVRLVVRINITMLDPKEVKIIDLTDESVQLKYFKSDTTAYDFSSRFDEVILEPKTCIPRICIQKIGTVQHKSFTKYSNITL